MPAEEAWVRKEYLTDFQSGHGEFTQSVWVSCKSILGRAFYFETYLPEYAAVYDKLPISAFVSEPKTPDPDMDLPNSTVLELHGLWCHNYMQTVYRFYGL